MNNHIINEQGRECSKCGTFKKWPLFAKNASNRTGYESSCKQCRNEHDRERRRKRYATDSEYRERARERARKTNKPLSQWTERQKADHYILKLQKRNTHWCAIDKTDGYLNRKGGEFRTGKHVVDRIVESNAKQAWTYWLKEKAPNWWLDKYYIATGKPWTDHRLTTTEHWRLRYKLDEEYAIKERLRKQIKKAKNNNGIGDCIRGAINRGGKSNKVERELGYTISQLKIHLERQFKRGMNWDEFKKGNIHIDHIIPQSHFDLQNKHEWVTCWSLNNLQPMWAKENLSKSAKICEEYGNNLPLQMEMAI